jgi:hypothetical protein
MKTEKETEKNSNFDYVENFRKVQDQGYELFKKKNQDYGNAFEEYGTIGILIRMNDKIKRAQTITNNKISLIDDESIKDTLIDLHNYCALAIVMMNKTEIEKKN